jgi:RND family efflux transporter MFP subunit
MTRTPWIIACIACGLTFTASSVWAQQFPPAPVVVAEVDRQEVTAGQPFVGTVMPSKRAVIGSAVDGRVVEFPHNDGEWVREGEPLAQLLTETIRLELAAAEAELLFRMEELAELENGSRPKEIEQAKAKMLAAKARLGFLDARKRRAEFLHKRGQSITEEELEQVVSEAAEGEQVYEDTKAAYELAVEGPRTERIAQARARVAVQRAVADRLNDQIQKHTIISRFSGFVTAEHTEVGQWVQRGDPVAEVAALDVVEVVAHVVEIHAPHVRAGETVRVEIPALPTLVTTGTVIGVVPQADVRARTFPVRVRVDNKITDEGPLLKAGMTARVILPTGAKQTALLVPKDALVLGGVQPVVYVVQPAPEEGPSTVQPVPVQLGVASGERIQVIGDLEPGQKVVVQGNERLRPGQQIVVSKSLKAESKPQAKPSTSVD